MSQQIKLQLCALAAFVLLLMPACQGGGKGQHDQRSEEQLQTYRSLNDSTQRLAPGALALVREQMEMATDSLTWYDYYLMYGRHYLLSDRPDSVLHYTSRVLGYIGRQPKQTERTNGMAAMALVAQAAYHYLLHHNADSVISTYMSAYRLMKKSDMEDNLPDLSANIGDAYVAKGNMPEGSRWYRRALFLVDSLRLPTKESITLYMGLGRIYTTLGDFDQAKNYYEMADKQVDQMKPNMQSY
ncbi:MAG: tetratricopeptide repeat protein, partial [Prevotella sp.]|nr:tetratricopeptide repeat protein [Prevotella sp.]